MGSIVSPMKPTMTITMEMTAEKTGLSMKKSAFMGYSSALLSMPSAAASPATGSTISTVMPGISL